MVIFISAIVRWIHMFIFFIKIILVERSKFHDKIANSWRCNNYSSDAPVLSMHFLHTYNNTQVWKCKGTSTFHFWNTLQTRCIKDRHRLEHGRTWVAELVLISQEEHVISLSVADNLLLSELYEVVYLSEVHQRWLRTDRELQ